MSTILTPIDFGTSFHKEMGELASIFHDFDSIPKDDLSRLYSKIPVSLIVEALDESDKTDFIEASFKPSCVSFSLREFVQEIVHNYFIDSVVELFNVERTHIRHYGLPSTDPMIDAGFSIHDFVNTKETNRIPSYAI